MDTWAQLTRIAVVGTSAYAALVVLLRLSGKRTLAKLSAFDVVVTVAIGSTLASVLLDISVSLLQGVAMTLLVVLIRAIVLETDGTLSVLHDIPPPPDGGGQS